MSRKLWPVKFWLGSRYKSKTNPAATTCSTLPGSGVHAVGGSGGRGAITRNLDGVACGEPADNGSRKNVQVEVLRKADLQRAAAGERKRPAGRRVVEQRERPAADGTADNRPAVEERQRTNTGGRIDGVAVQEFHGAAVGDRVTAEVGASETAGSPRGRAKLRSRSRRSPEQECRKTRLRPRSLSSRYPGPERHRCSPSRQ